LRTPRPEGGTKRASVTSVRPVAATTHAPAPSAARSTPGALPFFVSLGFAVGIGIVVLARLSVNPSPHAATEPAPAERAAAVSHPAPDGSTPRATTQATAKALTPASAVPLGSSARPRPARLAPSPAPDLRGRRQ